MNLRVSVCLHSFMSAIYAQSMYVSECAACFSLCGIDRVKLKWDLVVCSYGCSMDWYIDIRVYSRKLGRLF